MRKLRVFLVLFIVVLVPLTSVSVCFARPSSDFYEEDDNIFDDWGVCRTNAYGEGGYFPVEVERISETKYKYTLRAVFPLESVGEYIDTAYRLGEQFADKYPDRHQRAEKIFEYVRDRIQYTPDIDRWDMKEYAENADEVANILQEDGITYGDCEEFATLLAVMYKGAGFQSAIVLIFPGHSAVIVRVPGYEKANRQFSLKGESGWVWAEATGGTNPFGWCPPLEEVEGIILAYEIFSEEHLDLLQPPEEEELPPEPEEEELPPEPEREELPPVPPVTGGGPNPVSIILPVIVVLALTGIIILLRKRRRA